MATFSHEPTSRLRGDRELRLMVRDVFASLAISMMWLAVLLDLLFGPDIVSTDGIKGSVWSGARAVRVPRYLGSRALRISARAVGVAWRPGRRN